MTKQAKRPITVSFQDDSSCTFDSNDFVEFEILNDDLPMGEIVFKGMPYNTGLTELGRCVFDYCDHGLYVYQDLANMLYEARHPWLDYADAIEKKAFDFTNKTVERINEQFLYLNEDGRFEVTDLCTLKKFNGKKKIAQFKPIKPFDFHYFNEVKVYTPE